MTLVRGHLVDVPEDPFAGGSLRSHVDGALLVRDGVIQARGAAAELATAHPDEPVLDLRGGLVLPGLVDTHVHYPQVRIVGGLGRQLLEWLDERALPEEMRLADRTYARAVAEEFVTSLVSAGTTTALVFGAHFPDAVDELFAATHDAGLRVAAGLVVSDRFLPAPLLTTPERALAEGLRLAEQWHGVGRLRYAVTPRFSLSCTDTMLASCAELLTAVPGALFTSHVNENPAEVSRVRDLFGTAYVDSYDPHGLLGPLSVLAHDVHFCDDELAVLARRGTGIAHCPTSNTALASGAFPLRRHLAAGVRVALGTDVGAGMSFSILREGLHAYLVQRGLGERGQPLGAAELLYLATTAGARILGLPQVGHLSVGQRFDAVWVRPAPGSPLALSLPYAVDDADAVARTFALAGHGDLAGVWIDGSPLSRK